MLPAPISTLLVLLFDEAPELLPLLPPPLLRGSCREGDHGGHPDQPCQLAHESSS